MNYDHLFELPTFAVDKMVERLEIDAAQFKGKVALVTGSARGIGKQTAIGLASLGAHVAVLDKEESGADVVAFIQSQGWKAHFVHCDLSKRANLEAAFQEIRKVFGPVDILINNAVHFTIESFANMPIEEWELHQATNLGAAVIGTKLALPDMVAKGEGTVLNMVALEGMAYAAAMSSSKVAMRSLLFSLASELGNKSKVSVMGFAPGLVATPLISDVFVKYCQRLEIDFEDYVLRLGHNPGYPGLMPPEHCAASLIHALSTSVTYHGLIADPFHVLEKYGVIDTGKKFFAEQPPVKSLGSDVSDNVNRLREYISEVTALNGHIESRIEERTSEINKEKEIILRLLRKIREHNFEQRKTAKVLQAQKERLETINEELRKFAYVVSHDLKTPLRGISNLTTFIKMDLNGNTGAETIQNLDLLSSRVKRMETLINGILEYSRAGGVQVKKNEVDLNELLLDAVDLINPPKGFKISIAPDFPVLMVNKVALQQIFQNLIGNAINYHHKSEGHIEILHSRKDKFWEFCVKDDGPGIATEYHERIFRIFQTLKPKDEIEGTGLGLAIVKKTVEESGGKVWVESELGAGSSFRFTFPKHAVVEINRSKGEVNAD